MAVKPRKVWKLPLKELWDDANVVVSTEEIQSLGFAEIENLLEQGQVQFILVDFPYPYLQWMPLEEKDHILTELREHLVTDEEYESDDFEMEGHCYTASEWKTDLPVSLVLLIKHH